MNRGGISISIPTPPPLTTCNHTTLLLPSPINKHTNPPTSLVRLFLVDQQAITNAQIPRPPPAGHERRPRHGDHPRVHGVSAQQLEGVVSVAGREQQFQPQEHACDWGLPSGPAAEDALGRREEHVALLAVEGGCLGGVEEEALMGPPAEEGEEEDLGC